MSQLTKNFRSEEFACPCGKCTLHIEQRLVDALQKIRDLAATPIKITSGYRCVSHNKAVGGSPNSQHIRGIAADISIVGNSIEEMAQLAANVDEFKHGGIGVYPQENFIHVDVRGTVARWARVNGKYVSFSAGLDYKAKGKKA